MRVPAILDIEASGFGKGSYPIEVGIALPDGSVSSFLIKPHPDWTHWSVDAEALHGISQDYLQTHGATPREVAEQLNILLEGQTVYSDGWGVDSSWLSLLFYYAGWRQAFQLDTITRILSDEQLVLWDQTRDRLFKAHDGRRHRAGHDAKMLQETYIQTHEMARRQHLQGR